MENWDVFVSFPSQDPENVQLVIQATKNISETEKDKKTKFAALRLMSGCARYYRKSGIFPLSFSYLVALVIEWLSWLLRYLQRRAISPIPA